MSDFFENEGVRSRWVSACYLCGGERTRRLFAALRDRLFDAPGEWNLERCLDCGLIWLNPRPLREEFPKLYRTYYTHRLLHHPWDGFKQGLKRGLLALGFGYRNLSLQGWEYLLGGFGMILSPLREVVEGAVAWLPGHQRGRLLDVGCGNGRFLAQMREYGWEVKGIEPDPEAAQLAKREYGVEVWPGFPETAPFPVASFDAMVLQHVIEHLDDPRHVLRLCRGWLSPQGRLVVITPNAMSWGSKVWGRDWKPWDPPRHLFLFSPQALQRCMEAAGLRVRQWWTSSRSARIVWQESWQIRAGSRGTSHLLGIALGLLFQLLEHGAKSIGPWGEELVMVASAE